MTLEELYIELGSNPTPERMEKLFDLIDKESPENRPKIVIDPSHTCHMCGCYTEGECAFDLEMNPYSTPDPCCGSHQCAHDV